ncbi:flagellar hook assembly protein FlgD [Hyphomonas sp.]|uniref:flagellar hook assembly protein FlgD n=1 Tax=Hyphomonas sp. TaxID=87 RepID=UPI00356A44EC
MTTIAPTTSTTPSPVATAPTEQAQIGEEYNSFLKLLTAQLKNQDPLAPLDSTQFVEQLATFSSLEQDVKSNSSLDIIAAKMSDLYAIAATQWIGQTVSVETSWVPFSSQAVDFTVDIPEEADRAILSVKNSAGEVVWTKTLDPKADSFSWDGSNQATNAISPVGQYQFGIELYRSDEYYGTVAPQLASS